MSACRTNRANAEPLLFTSRLFLERSRCGPSLPEDRAPCLRCAACAWTSNGQPRTATGSTGASAISGARRGTGCIFLWRMPSSSR
eukprot:scaffold5730_cov90-Isochrysis_galbana.AAC.1